MYIKSDDGCIYHDLYDYHVDKGIHHVALIIDTVRWFKFDSLGNQISSNPYYTLFL